MDSIFGIGFPELVFIAVLALIILGPERLPGTLREIAKYWGYIRNLSGQLTSQFSEEFKVLNELNPKKLLNELADEEMAKEDKAKQASPATSKAKPTTPVKPTTPAKPAAPTPAKTDASPASTNPAVTTTREKPTETEQATPLSTPVAASEAVALVENSILPPKVAESGIALSTPNGGSATNGTVNSSATAEADVPAAKPMVASVTASSGNGAKDPAEVAE